MEDFLSNDWPLLIAIAAAVFVVYGLIMKIVKLAIFAGILAVGAFILWPFVTGAIG